MNPIENFVWFLYCQHKPAQGFNMFRSRYLVFIFQCMENHIIQSFLHHCSFFYKFKKEIHKDVCMKDLISPPTFISSFPSLKVLTALLFFHTSFSSTNPPANVPLSGSILGIIFCQYFKITSMKTHRSNTKISFSFLPHQLFSICSDKTA